ncbi:MAG: hypothetical protein JKY45_06475 [Emcibacter sp.]|nr:hypothetical protein [Emcibacter sp.]
MPVKTLYPIMICAAGLAATPLLSPAQAMPMTFTGITLEVRESTYQVAGGDNAGSLMAEFNSGGLLCNVNLGVFPTVQR